MTDKNASQRIESAMGAIAAVYTGSGPDVESAEQRHDFATAALAESNVAIATAILELAEAVRDRD